MDQIYIGRQPILDKHGETFAYELLYRDNEDSAHAFLPENQRTASIHVLNTVTKHFNIDDILDSKLGFIKVDRSFLLHDFIYTIDKDRFVLSVLENVDIDDKLEERFHELFKKGYKLAINDMTLSRDVIMKFRPVIPYFQYAKFSTNIEIDAYFKKMLAVLKMFDVKLIATKVEDKEGFKKFADLDTQYFQGFYFSKPELMKTTKDNPLLSTVMQLFRLLQSSASSLEEIQFVFEKSPTLSLQMLKILNSPLFSLEKEVSSILQALTLIGRKPLTDWILLLIYSKDVNKSSASTSALFKLAKQRSELMVLLLKKIYPAQVKVLEHQAKFMGIISLYDALFNTSLEAIFKDLPLSEEIKEGLLHNQGILGELFEVVLAAETFNTKFIEHFAKQHNIESTDFCHFVVSSLKTADEVQRVVL